MSQDSGSAPKLPDPALMITCSATVLLSVQVPAMRAIAAKHVLKKATNVPMDLAFPALRSVMEPTTVHDEATNSCVVVAARRLSFLAAIHVWQVHCVVTAMQIVATEATKKAAIRRPAKRGNIAATMAAVPAEGICDGVYDCVWRSDESNCPSRAVAQGDEEPQRSECGILQFTCGDGSCLPHRWHCNGVADCADGSDEDELQCERDVPCPNAFRCFDGSCIPEHCTCDGMLSSFFDPLTNECHLFV